MDGPQTTITLVTGGTLPVAESLEEVEAALRAGSHCRFDRVVRGHGGWVRQAVIVSAAHVVCVEPAA